jgi:tetratricopeptide (TPR) repeat protein
MLAASYAVGGERGAEAVISEAEAVAGRSIPQALRAILIRCLAATPSDRYRRSLELAEDLDRWRCDLPLAYAAEPFWGQTLPRWLRRRKTPLAAAALICTASLGTASLVTSQSRSTFQGLALHKLARSWDDIESRVFQFHRPGSLSLQNPDAPDVLATAVQALKSYDVLENRDWRRGQEVRSLPAADREDLELWLMEQALRYCHGLAERRGTPGDWLRALSVLDQVDTSPSLHAFDQLRHRLTDKLAQAGSSRDRAGVASLASTKRSPWSTGPAQRPEARSLDDYLMGVEAELNDRPVSSGEAGTDLAISALGHYDRVLAQSPESFWGHYRAAVVCFRLKRWSDAAGHLDRCLRRRPRNAALRGQFASCLSQMGLLDDALQECDRALDSAPDHAEFYRSRAFIRANQGRTEGLEDDLKRFEMLSRSLGGSFFRCPPVRSLGDSGSAVVSTSRRALDLESRPGFAPHPDEPLIEDKEIDAEEIDARAVLAATICRLGGRTLRGEPALSEAVRPSPLANSVARPIGALGIAATELDKVLALDRGHLTARMTRMMQSLEERRFGEARDDLERVLQHPGLPDHLRTGPEKFDFLHLAAQRFARFGLIAEALDIADTAIEESIQLGLPRGRSHYCKATILGIAARTDPGQIDPAVEQLRLAFSANPRFQEWYRGDRIFDRVRTPIDAALFRLSNPGLKD